MRIISLLAAATIAATQTITALPDETEAMKFLYDSMPLSDRLMKSEQYYLDNVKVSLRAADDLPWVSDIPEDIWYHFVLPVRSNNETIDDFRTTYYEELRDRVKGMTMHDAALEVNHWLHEKVTYEPSDSRTSAPAATIRTAKGRCGEESVLGVAAMRAVGIPARQVYTPRWAHTDDNHAWVEVWIDGKWYFLGACEPEPELNRAWFNSPASRGMMMHTRVFGKYDGNEQVLSRKGNITEINVTDNYVPVRDNYVTVYGSEGTPLKGIPVSFHIYNYAEFYPVATFMTDSAGRVMLRTGCGEMLAWATDGKNFGFAKISGLETRLDMTTPLGQEFSCDLTIIPPAENPIPAYATQQQIEENARRMAVEDSIRNAYTATFYTPQPGDSPRVSALLVKARGNWREICSFIDSVDPDRIDDALDMLEAVSDKDLRDTPAFVFSATLEATPVWQSRETTQHLNRDMYVNYVLNPRIDNELLSPYRMTLGTPATSPGDIIALAADSIIVDDVANGYNVPVTPSEAWFGRKADSHSRDILFVAMCRNSGIAARINEISGRPQYYDGRDWITVDFVKVSDKKVPQGYLTATYSPIPYLENPQYYRHFTISDLSTGRPALLEFDEDAATYKTTLADTLTIDEGYYMLTSGTRMADGSVLAHIEAFPVRHDSLTTVPLVLRNNPQQIRVIGNMDCEALYKTPDDTDRSILSTTGRGYFIICVLGATDEPSNHAVTELAAISEDLNRWGCPILMLKPNAAARHELDDIKLLSYGSDPDNSIASMLRIGTDSRKSQLPVIAVADSFGRIVFISEGYDTSLGSKIKSIISRL